MDMDSFVVSYCGEDWKGWFFSRWGKEQVYDLRTSFSATELPVLVKVDKVEVYVFYMI